MRKLVCLFLIWLPLGLNSCSDSEDLKACFPDDSRLLSGDTVRYEYNSLNQVTRISTSYGSGELAGEDEFDYDNQGRLIAVRRIRVKLDGTKTTYGTYEFQYIGNSDIPTALNHWSNNTSLPPFVWTFTHDSDGKLLTRQEQFGTVDNYTRYRYEYDDSGNVSKIFYTRPDSDEVLGQENLSFDSRDRFYSDVRGLEVFYVYIRRAEPSRNNKRTAIAYYDGPNIQFGTPVSVTFMMTYNSEGLIESLYPKEIQLEEFGFQKMTYNCR